MKKSLPLLLALALLGTGGVEAEERLNGVAGRVKGQASPLPSAGVYAYQLADLSLHKVSTDAQGRFLFRDLPAGLYKIIAHKQGFLPAIALLTRSTSQAYQVIELELAERRPGQPDAAGNDFWSIRARIPPDVLRDIEFQEGELHLTSFEPPKAGQGLFHTEMQAMTGVEGTPSTGGGQVSDGRLGIEGRLGGVQVDFSGRFSQFSPGAFAPESGAGIAVGGSQASVLSLDLEAGDSSRISLSSFNNRMLTRTVEGDETPIDLEHYQVSWSQDVGENGRSDFAAQYTNENNYHRHGWIDPIEIPEASRTWRVEGAYTTALGDRGTLQTGLRYRERQFGLGASAEEPGQSSIDLFGRGGTRIQPAVLVEYGLYSTLSDGSLSLAPQGGIVLQLGANWQAKASASRRVYQDVPALNNFMPALYEEGDLCEQGSDACYEVQVSRKVGEDEDNQISFGALHRTVGETLRLYFSDQFADRLESLYLVRGDELPELQLTMSRKLSPQVLTTLQSRLASGGGGTFVTSDRQSYENKVRYLVTSLDTQFQSTATGVFVAFHRLEQNIDPVDTPEQNSARLEFERLRLMLSQDLNILLDLAADWAVQLNMEVSRGTTLSTNSSDELRRRFLGGIAVKF